MSRRLRLLAQALAVPILAAASWLPAAPAAHAAGGRCADSPHYDVKYWAQSAPVASLDVNIMACPWTTPDQWTVQALPHNLPGDDLTEHRLRAWVVNGDTTPTYRTVTVEASLSRCTLGGCDPNIASWKITYLIGNDGVYVKRTETIQNTCGYNSCEYCLTAQDS